MGTVVYPGVSVLVCQSGAWQRYVKTSGDVMSGQLNIHSGWPLALRNPAGQDNAQPTNADGSAYLNDIYVRSIGRWVSQVENPNITVIGWYGSTGGGAIGLGWWRYCWISGINGGSNSAGVNPITGSNGQGQYYWTVENHPTGSSNILVSCYN